MSKIGRKAIDISGVQIEVNGQDVYFKGAHASGVHTLPADLCVDVQENVLFVKPSKAIRQRKQRLVFQDWGLHRALLSNKIQGSKQKFSTDVQITGLGYKAVQSGNALTLTLGYSHKVNFDIPQDISVVIDRSGQKLTFESFDNELLGSTISRLKALKPTEPYKGTGIKCAHDIILRKDSKGKA